MRNAIKKHLKPSKAPQLEDLLAEAMKQPGINDVMQVVQASEAYMRAAETFYALVEQQKYPAFISTCHTSGSV